VHSFDLPNRHPKTPRLRFDWDPLTGTVSGPDADLVKEWIPLWWIDGKIAFPHPYPGVTFKSGNPLTDPRGMYLILAGNDYEVPKWLAKSAPGYRDRRKIIPGVPYVN
jgi:hypothetical protein